MKIKKCPNLFFFAVGISAMTGHANGFMSLTGDCKIIVFSTSTIEESLKDDYRFDARYWNPWKVEER